MDKFFQNVNPSSEFPLTAVISSILWFSEEYMCPNLAFIWLCKEWNGFQEYLINDVFKGEYKFIIINAQIFLMAKSPVTNMTFSQCQWAYISSVQSLSHVWLWPHESQHVRPPCPSQTPAVYSNTCPSSQWCHPAISSSVIPFSSFPQSLPASGSFPTSQLFPWGGQSIGVSASASVLAMNTQDWSPLG